MVIKKIVNKLKPLSKVYVLYALSILIITIFLSVKILNDEIQSPISIIKKTGRLTGILTALEAEDVWFLGNELTEEQVKFLQMCKAMDEIETNPNRFYNSLGFKDVEWKIEKTPNTYRIVALGDSVTHGLSLPSENTWPKQLERKLNELNFSKKFEVFNMGQGGFSTFEEVEVFKNVGLNYTPDMVILQYHESDWQSPAEVWGELDLWEKYKSGEYKLPDNVEATIKGLNISEREISRLISYVAFKEYVRQADFKEEWEKWSKEPLIELIELTNERNIKLMIIAWDSHDRGKLKFPFDALISLLKNYNITLYDFTPHLPEPETCPSPTRLDPDCHLSALGCELVANKTLDIINELVIKSD